MDTVTKSVPENAVCGPNGKPIAFPEDMRGDMLRVVYLVKERFDRSYAVERGLDDDNQVYLVPVDPARERALTVPERAAIEAFAWYCREYIGDLRRNTSVTFPKIIHDRNEEPFSFCDEARAYMFAEVAESVFGVDTQVIETPAGWAVAVSNDRRGLNAEELAHLQGACRVLMGFTVEAADMVCASQSSNYMRRTPDPESRAAWHDRKNAPLARIESALGEILSRLDQNAATGAQTALATAGAQSIPSEKKSRRSA